MKLNGGRQVSGVLRGFDQFMNLVVDEAIEVTGSGNNEIGMVVRAACPARRDDTGSLTLCSTAGDPWQQRHDDGAARERRGASTRPIRLEAAADGVTFVRSLVRPQPVYVYHAFAP